MREIGRVAESLRQAGRRQINYEVKKPQFGIVRRVEPELSVEMTEGRLTLDEDDLTISQAVRIYERDYGLKVGDTVVLVPIGHGDYVVQEVVADKDKFEGISTKANMGGGTIGGGSDSDTVTIPDGGGSDTVNITISGTPIVGTVPYLDEEGNVIGRIPLLAP